MIGASSTQNIFLLIGEKKYLVFPLWNMMNHIYTYTYIYVHICFRHGDVEPYCRSEGEDKNVIENTMQDGLKKSVIEMLPHRKIKQRNK